ncbi:hypothetical protein GCM10010123_02710 [Pilimelia anulata]|uniref:Anti-sigma factor antagonist n=1 Tax=Pilimelia anulata TaxID=53371 RepID=A0A8J3B3I4_9ACTN|nr:hypothetical protein GCM10010123_02710 [Pilimelia anulata]
MTVRVRQLPDDEVEIVPSGEIDIDTAHEIRDTITRLLTDRPRRIALNLRAVSFMDSVGISSLVAGFQAASVTGAKLVVTDLSPAVHRTLWVTGLHGLFGAPTPSLATG